MQQQITRLRSGRLGRFAYDRDAVPTVGALCKALVAVGDLEAAMRELEPLLCGEAPDPYGRTPNRNPAQVRKALTELLTAEVAGREAWLAAVGERVLSWQAESRLLDAQKVLAAVGMQLAGVGLSELGLTSQRQQRGRCPQAPQAFEELIAHRPGIGSELTPSLLAGSRNQCGFDRDTCPQGLSVEPLALEQDGPRLTASGRGAKTLQESIRGGSDRFHGSAGWEEAPELG